MQKKSGYEERQFLGIINMFINETVLLLTPFEDCSGQRLAEHIQCHLFVSIPVDECFYDPLKKIFSKVIIYDYWKRIIELGITDINDEIIKLVKKEHPKYVLWVSIGEYYEIKESTFRAIRKEGSFIIGWFFDVDIRFDYYTKWFVSYIDYIITDDIESVPKFKEIGVWVTHAICTCNPLYLKINEEKYTISFVGSLRANREQYINEIKKRNIPIHLFGLASGTFVSYQEMLVIFSTSKINLNFSMNFINNKLAIKARIFEVCLAGGFLLTEYFPGIEDFFEIDKEIVCFKNIKEMIMKIEYYINHEDKRIAIARAGWKRAISEYSSFNIMSRIFREIEANNYIVKKDLVKKISLPCTIRKRISEFYLSYGDAFLRENRKDSSKDALALSIYYYPCNSRAWKLFFYCSFQYPINIILKIIRRGMGIFKKGFKL